MTRHSNLTHTRGAIAADPLCPRRMTTLFAGVALALLASGGTYAQTATAACCPAAAARPAETEGVGRGPTLAETEGAGRGPTLAETEGAGRGPKLAEAKGTAPGSQYAWAEGAGVASKLAETAPCTPCP